MPYPNQTRTRGVAAQKTLIKVMTVISALCNLDVWQAQSDTGLGLTTVGLEVVTLTMRLKFMGASVCHQHVSLGVVYLSE